MDIYRNQKLIPTNFWSHEIDNRIILCEKCDKLYKESPIEGGPAIVILPNDLEFFIQYEEIDFSSRQLAALRYPEADIQPRTIPSALDYGDREYTTYIMADSRVLICHKELSRQIMHGNLRRKYGALPAAIILKAALWMGRVMQQTSEPGFGIPAEVRNKLSHLLGLWERQDISPNFDKSQIPVGNQSLSTVTIASEESFERRKSSQGEWETAVGIDDLPKQIWGDKHQAVRGSLNAFIASRTDSTSKSLCSATQEGHESVIQHAELFPISKDQDEDTRPTLLKDIENLLRNRTSYNSEKTSEKSQAMKELLDSLKIILSNERDHLVPKPLGLTSNPFKGQNPVRETVQALRTLPKSLFEEETLQSGEWQLESSSDNNSYDSLRSSGDSGVDSDASVISNESRSGSQNM